MFFFGLAVHPFITYPLSLALMERWRTPAPVPPSTSVNRPRVAICMSAYNEEKVIAHKIETLLAMAEHYGNASIHVYADAPTDGTSAILQGYADKIDLVVSSRRSGKTHGMNVLVARSQSELILFTDANVISDAAVLEPLTAAFDDPAIGMVSARLLYSNREESAASETGASYWAIEEAIKAIESRTIGLIGVDGAMFMMRRSLHNPPPPYLIDDLMLSLDVLVQGKRLISVPHVKVYERSAVHNREEYLRKKRISCQAMNVHRHMWPRLRSMPADRLYAYISHRLIKWLTPFFVSAGLLFWLVAAVRITGIAPVLIGIITAALLIFVGARLHIRPISVILSVFTSLAGVMAGVLQSLFTDEKYSSWSPVESVRAGAGKHHK